MRHAIHLLTPSCLALIALTGCVSPLATAASKGQAPVPLSYRADEKRVALVIGNTAYEHRRLRNAGNDARDLADLLRRLNFEVIEGYDCTERGLRKQIAKFRDALPRNGVGLFYYSGHGVQVEGLNYLIPVGAAMAEPADAQADCVELDDVVEAMAGSACRLNIVLLDACRDNPFREHWGIRRRGLAPLKTPRASLVFYATAPGEVASDGDPNERNGLFAKALLSHLATPGIPVEEVCKRVTKQVEEESEGAQVPRYFSTLTTDFYFKLGESPPPPPLIVDADGAGDFRTISSALRAASVDTRIVVRAGRYRESLVIDRPVMLVGEGDRESIVIEGRGSSTIRFSASSGRIAGITIRHPGGDRCHAVDIQQGVLILEDCDISSRAVAVAGVNVSDEATPVIRRNRIANCLGSGISLLEDSQGVIEDNEIVGNAGRGIRISGNGNPVVRDNRIAGNREGGVEVTDWGKGMIEANKISDNIGAGVIVRHNGDPTVRQNSIVDGQTCGILVQAGGGTFEENDILGNSEDGVRILSGAYATVRSNTISKNPNGIVVRDGGSGQILGNTVVENRRFGILVIGRGSNPLVQENCIKGNGRAAIAVSDQGGGIFSRNELRDNRGGAWNIDDSSRDLTQRNNNREW